MMRKTLFAVFILFGLVMLLVSGQALAATQTAQSVMVKLDFDNPAYIIEGTITWTFHRATAETFYTNAWDGSSPTVTCSGGGNNGCVTAPATPAAPAPTANKLQQHAQAERCTFFLGGNLGSDSYTQVVTVNVSSPAPQAQRGNWRFTYTYNITPKQSSVSPGEGDTWTSEETGGWVDVGFRGFISSESFVKNNQGGNADRTKYSFTATEDGISRVRNVVAQLQESTDGGATWNDVGDPIQFGVYDDISSNWILAVTPTTENYLYFGNAGVFGNATVYQFLHAPQPGGPGYLPAALVSAILLQDNFANNNNDLLNGNVHKADFDNNGNEFILYEDGLYRIQVMGSIKGNDAGGGFNFNVLSDMTVIGGCE